MALPSGYSKIDYIEANGTQYINTGFTPNGKDHIVMDCEPTDLSSTFCFFCARTETNASDTTSNTIFYLSGKYRKDFYGESQNTSAAYAAGKRFTLDSNKNIVAFGSDYTLTFTASSNVSPMPLILMASAIPGDTAGALKNLANYAKMKLYSCKIYRNGLPVRNFEPCKNSSGVLGLWDHINSKFYTNAGTGTFTTGSKHKTLIGGTGYEIKSGRVLIGGTGYDIKKGRTLIDGTGYDISFGTPVGELEEGALVKINENGSPVEFYVAKHDYESSLNGSGRTLVVRKDCHSKRPYSSRTGCTFPDSILYTWLNNTYITYLDDFIRSAIGTTKFKYTSGSTYTTGKCTTGECAVFLLGIAEVDPANGTDELHDETYEDGTLLPIADTLKIAYYDGSPVSQWTRAWGINNGTTIMCMNTSGSRKYFTVLNNASATNGVRPIFTLPSDMSVDSDFNIIPT